MAKNSRHDYRGVQAVLRKIDKYVPGQKNTGQHIGAIKELFGRTSFYITVINFFLLIVTAYYTTIRNFIPVSFVVFMVFTLVLVGIAMIVEYILILPSSMAFQNMQAYKHTNPLKDDIKEILDRIDKIENNTRK